MSVHIRIYIYILHLVARFAVTVARVTLNLRHLVNTDQVLIHHYYNCRQRTITIFYSWI